MSTFHAVLLAGVAALNIVLAGPAVAQERIKSGEINSYKSQPAAICQAEDLITREKVDMLAGAFYDNIGTALTDYARQKQRFMLVTEALSDNSVWSIGDSYTFSLDASTSMLLSSLVDSALKLHGDRWALMDLRVYRRGSTTRRGDDHGPR